MSEEDTFDEIGEDLFDDLGVTATFTPAVGDAVSCKVNLVQNLEMIPGGYEAQVWAGAKQLEYVLDDIGREANEGETFTIGVTVYTVQSILENDGRFVKAIVTS